MKKVRPCLGEYGAANKNSSRLTAQLEAVLSALEVLALEAPVDAVYGVIRAGLERSGQPIGANDMLIRRDLAYDAGRRSIGFNRGGAAKAGSLPVRPSSRRKRRW
jgi:hypothetical protein